MNRILITVIISMFLVSVCGYAGAANSNMIINVDGHDKGLVFDGIGGLSAGANSRLLIDYPEPQRSQILDYLFKPNFGMSLHILKVEIGGDVWTTWGSEPSFAVSREEFEHPKPEYFNRGYEWWLMEEAKKRNPNIILQSLQWGAPGWIGNGNFESQDNADYIAGFIKGARDYHGLTINYQGIHNENLYTKDWVKTLRKTLDSNGLQNVKLSVNDGKAERGDWDVVLKDVTTDPEFAKLVDNISMHYPWYSSPEKAKTLGKPLWDSEDASLTPVHAPWARAAGYASLWNRNYIDGRFTETVICALITSNFSFLRPWGMPTGNDSGLTVANSPWSGHYEISPIIWATAHTTQFTQPGWRYLDGACGLLGDFGSYVTLRSPDSSGNYSIIIETMKDIPYNINNMAWGDPTRGDTPGIPERLLRFNVKNLSAGSIHVWRSNKTEQFVQLPDITPKDGSFEITVDGNSIYSLTTTTGQHKGFYDIPKDKPFPFPYKDNFDSTVPGKTPKYFSDQEGTFEVAKRIDGKGNCLRQISPQRGIEWCGIISYPWTLIGNEDWKDYEVAVDVHVVAKGFGGLYGRMDDALNRPMGGYNFTIDNTGTWQMKDTYTVLASGQIKTSSDSWHNLRLKFKGTHVIGMIDGKTVCSLVDDFHANGAVGLVSSFDNIEFDNFAIKKFKEKVSKPPVNLALGMKASVSSEVGNGSSAALAIDGNHSNGWSPQTGKKPDEWLVIDFGKNVTFDRIVIDHHITNWYGSGITGYKIQYWNGENWKDLVIGKNMSVHQIDDFTPVTAGKVRLLVTSHEENACIYEFEVYKYK